MAWGVAPPNCARQRTDRITTCMSAADGKHAPVLVVERRDHTDDLWSIRVRHEEAFPFTPGQYATLALPPHRGDKLVERAYSIVSDPEEDTIEFFFELVPEGALTPLLYEKGVGDEIL